MANINTTSGLYINSSYISLARADLDDAHILTISIQPLDVDLEDLWSRIKLGIDVLFEGLALKKENIALSLPGELAIIKSFEIENDDTDPEEAIKWEFSQQIIESLEEYAYDFEKRSEGSSDSLFSTYFLTAYKQSAIDQLTELIRSKKQNPVVVELDIFALINVFEMNYPEKLENPTIIIFSEIDKTKIILTQNGTFIDLETILPNETNLQVDEIEKSVSRLIQINKSKLVSNIVTVFLTGDSFSDDAFVDTIKNKYPESEILYPFNKLTNTSGISEEDLHTYAPRLGVAVGLAMRDAEL